MSQNHIYELRISAAYLDEDKPSVESYEEEEALVNRLEELGEEKELYTGAAQVRVLEPLPDIDSAVGQLIGVVGGSVVLEKEGVDPGDVRDPL